MSKWYFFQILSNLSLCSLYSLNNQYSQHSEHSQHSRHSRHSPLSQLSQLIQFSQHSQLSAVDQSLFLRDYSGFVDGRSSVHSEASDRVLKGHNLAPLGYFHLELQKI